MGPIRSNRGWEELIRPVAELRVYPALIRISIIEARVRSRPAARSTITRYRSGTGTSGGACH